MTRCWAVAIKNGWQDSSVALGNLPEVNKKKKLKKNTQYNYNKLRPKKYVGLLLPKHPCQKLPTKIFFRRNLQKIIEDLFKKFYVFLVTITSCICLLKSQIFASSVCHLMQLGWFNFLVNDFVVLKFS